MAEKKLSVYEAIALIVGLIIGVGIFATPSLVAQQVAGDVTLLGITLKAETFYLTLWALGGLFTLIGALCYAELGSSFPGSGGEYHYLARAYGQKLAVLFAWARGTVIQTGAIAFVAFVYGDYATKLLPLGTYSSAIHAFSAVIILTLINIAGLDPTKRTQVVLTVLEVSSLVAVTVAGLWVTSAAPSTAIAAPAAQSLGAAGLAMVFILLTYGGWNEISYLTGDLKNPRRTLALTLIFSTLIVTALYIVINYAYMSALGLEGLRKSSGVGADVMKLFAGETGERVITVMVIICLLSTMNATILTGARVYYALGKDLSALSALGNWDERAHKPRNALLLQGSIAMLLIFFGGLTRDGFKAMVEYTAPVFWFFLLMVGISVFILRSKKPEQASPYRVPLYPVTPIVFCLTCGWLLYSSVTYTGYGSLFGIGVLLLGIPLLFLSGKKR
jgi:APA family basic amino acid/polyamine antiporter